VPCIALASLAETASGGFHHASISARSSRRGHGLTPLSFQPALSGAWKLSVFQGGHPSAPETPFACNRPRRNFKHALDWSWSPQAGCIRSVVIDLQHALAFIYSPERVQARSLDGAGSPVALDCSTHPSSYCSRHLVTPHIRSLFSSHVDLSDWGLYLINLRGLLLYMRIRPSLTCPQGVMLCECSTDVTVFRSAALAALLLLKTIRAKRA
jgi:hypothetical protein